MLDIFKDSVDQIRQLITPDKYFAWVMAFVAEGSGATPLTVGILSTGSWLFLTVAVWWALANNPVKILEVSISPWLTGILICIFVFNPWTEGRFRLAAAAWPVVSTAVAGLPSLLDWDLKWKKITPQLRQSLILLLLLNLLLSSWIVFYFRIQEWLDDYPSMLVDNFEQSSFVYRFQEAPGGFTQGTPLLEDASTLLAKQLDGTPWPQVERWLINADDGITQIAKAIDVTVASENPYWSLSSLQPTENANGYDIKLRANWLGPTSKGTPYFVEKTCRIIPQRQTRVTTPSGRTSVVQQNLTPIAKVSCDKNNSEIKWIAPVEAVKS
jgi:Family of unknown function (DUF5357)